MHVEESGLSSVSDDEDEARQVWEDEAGMWETALESIRMHLES